MGRAATMPGRPIALGGVSPQATKDVATMAVPSHRRLNTQSNDPVAAGDLIPRP